MAFSNEQIRKLKQGYSIEVSAKGIYQVFEKYRSGDAFEYEGVWVYISNLNEREGVAKVKMVPGSDRY